MRMILPPEAVDQLKSFLLNCLMSFSLNSRSVTVDVGDPTSPRSVLVDAEDDAFPTLMLAPPPEGNSRGCSATDLRAMASKYMYDQSSAVRRTACEYF